MKAREVIPIELDNALGFNLYRVAQLFRRELMKALADDELTPEQWQILAALWWAREDLSQSEITHLTLKDKHSVSRIISRLERDGWVTRIPSPDDRREVRVRATKKAWRRREAVRGELYRHFEPILATLDSGEQATLLALLKNLRSKLESPVP